MDSGYENKYRVFYFFNGVLFLNLNDVQHTHTHTKKVIKQRRNIIIIIIFIK